MFTKQAISNIRKTCIATAVAIMAGCGGSDGSSGTGIDDPVTVAPEKPYAGPLAADKPLAKAYDDAARAFSVSSDNPILHWNYRVWCQTGYRSPGDAGTGQVVDSPLDITKDYLSPAGFNFASSLGKIVVEGGAKFLDNAWYFGTDYTGAVIVKLPDGSLILFDALTTPDDMQKQIIDQMPAAGLNPADIKYIFVGHEHGDHYGGVNLLLQNHTPNAKVIATRPAADTILAARARAETKTYTGTADEQAAAKAKALLAIPAKFDVIVEPFAGVPIGLQRITVADGIDAVAMLAPGHTPGQMGVIIPVVHQGETRKLFVWSGNDQPSAADQYAASTDFYAANAFKEGAEAIINTHSYQGSMYAHLRALKADPSAPNYLWMGKQNVQRFMGIFASCQHAIAERLRDGTWKVF